MSQSIVCPKCNYPIELSAALTSQMREHLRKAIDAENQQRETEFAQKDLNLRQRELAVETLRQTLDEEIAKRVSGERDRLQRDARTEAQAAVALEVEELEGQLSESRAKLLDAQKAELRIRRERQELADQKAELELTLTRQLDEERSHIREAARQELMEEARLRDADKEKLVADLRGQIDDLKRLSEQGSPQARGEVMELVLEDFLRDSFSLDTIEAVPVSYHGGDVLQQIHDQSGRDCGTILWESKRTKCWNDGWLAKLRDDQRAAKAHVAVLVTTEMPKGVSTFACIDGVWVTNRHCLLGLAVALRFGMIEAARAKRSVEGQQTKAALLHSYLSSTEFRQRIEGIVEALVRMKEDLDSERRSLHRLWAKREKQLDRAMLSTSGLYGDLGGLLGTTLPPSPISNWPPSPRAVRQKIWRRPRGNEA